MIVIKNTPNLTGVTISGEFNDLYNLVEAFHTITIDEFSKKKHHRYIDISIRALGLCYDIRHAYQGDREVELVDNNMTTDKMKWHSIIAPGENLYYSCNALYPEMYFVMLALNALVEIRMGDLGGFGLNGSINNKVAWDQTITAIRTFQAAFTDCVRETLTKASFARWMNVMNGSDIDIDEIAGQYVDLLNIKHIEMSKEKRLKSLSPLAKRIAQFSHYTEHQQIKDVVVEAAKEYKCMPGDIRLQGIEYPEDFAW